VWLAWFLAATLNAFASVCEARGDAERAGRNRRHARSLGEAVDLHGWDGAWYRRAYFDDGSPLGSASNDECAIDSIAQSWAVNAGVGDPDRARNAMRSMEDKLVLHDGGGLILLLTPPFDTSERDPGYIKGYVPGVRENGGQYTHAALWAVLAAARLGDGDRAMEWFALLNPVNHSRTAEEVHRYRSEPYVVAADVYAAPQHLGRGGWSWYTGSASWMYRIALEGLLGVRLDGDQLVLDPVIPHSWPGFEVRYRRGTTTYTITVENPDGVSRGVRSVTLDGNELPGAATPLLDDGHAHVVRVALGEKR
jgi:cyclic beta-1,2-glucan synthetase